MNRSIQKRLHKFYDDALLNPEVLCLNCARTAWNRAACRCSEERKTDCLYFARDMIIELARPPKADQALNSDATCAEFQQLGFTSKIA